MKIESIDMNTNSNYDFQMKIDSNHFSFLQKLININSNHFSFLQKLININHLTRKAREDERFKSIFSFIRFGSNQLTCKMNDLNQNIRSIFDSNQAFIKASFYVKLTNKKKKIQNLLQTP